MRLTENNKGNLCVAHGRQQRLLLFTENDLGIFLWPKDIDKGSLLMAHGNKWCKNFKVDLVFFCNPTVSHFDTFVSFKPASLSYFS